MEKKMYAEMVRRISKKDGTFEKEVLGYKEISDIGEYLKFEAAQDGYSYKNLTVDIYEGDLVKKGTYKLANPVEQVTEEVK